MTREKLVRSGILKYNGTVSKVLLYIMTDDVNLSIKGSDIVNATGESRKEVYRALRKLEDKELIKVSRGKTHTSPSIVSMCEKVDSGTHSISPGSTTMSYDMIIDIDGKSTGAAERPPYVESAEICENADSGTNSETESGTDVVTNTVTTQEPNISVSAREVSLLGDTKVVTNSETESGTDVVTNPVTETAQILMSGEDRYMGDDINIYISFIINLFEKEEYSNFRRASKIYDIYKEHIRGSSIRKDAVKKIDDLLCGTHYYDKNKAYTSEELLTSIFLYKEQFKGKGGGVLYDANSFFGRGLIFHCYLPGSDNVENVSEMREEIEKRRSDANEIVSYYEKLLKPSGRRLDALGSVEELLYPKYGGRKYTKEDLYDAMRAYGKTRAGQNVEYHYEAANFFGKSAYFYGFLPENMPGKATSNSEKDDGIVRLVME